MSTAPIAPHPVTISFDKFWSWLEAHPNCILRAGTPDAVLFDDEDLHWHFAPAEDGQRIVQLLRGKRLLGELVVAPSAISYVQGAPGESDEEFIFDLFGEVQTRHDALYQFVLSHGFDEADEPKGRRWEH